jgi:hypothetical protein
MRILQNKFILIGRNLKKFKFWISLSWNPQKISDILTSTESSHHNQLKEKNIYQNWMKILYTF